MSDSESILCFTESLLLSSSFRFLLRHDIETPEPLATSIPLKSDRYPSTRWRHPEAPFSSFSTGIIIHINTLARLKGTSAAQQYQSRIRDFLSFYQYKQLKFDNSLYIIHTKWFVLIIEFLAGRHLEMWRICVAVLDPHSFFSIVFIKSRDWHYNATRHISRWRPQGIQWSKQIAWRELYTDNFQIWVADVHTGWGKLLFEIDILGQPRFPLKLDILGVTNLKQQLSQAWSFLHMHFKLFLVHIIAALGLQFDACRALPTPLYLLPSENRSTHSLFAMF